MSLWCMFASPLALTCDLRETPQGEANSGQTMPNPLITEADIKTLTNTEILAINQDSLGQQAEYMEALSTGKTDYSNSGYDVYVKDLVNGRMAISVTNRGGSDVEVPVLKLTDLYLKADTIYTCRELWSKTEIDVENTLNVGTLKPYETKVYVLSVKPVVIDAIQNVAEATKMSKAPRYDISGRQVNENYKGVSIKNGVKTVNM